MHELYELKEKLLQELEEYGRKELSPGTLEVVDKLSHAIKNVCKIIEMKEEEEGYSGEMGGSYQRGGGSRGGGNRGGGQGGGSNRGGSYDGGGSYARGDGRGRGRNARRDSMGRYSSERGGSYERGYSREGDDLAMQLRELMEDAPDETIRRDMEKLLRKVEQM